ncbi:prolyl oligopeptidase family serine peptidase [Porifericola rhodea]|uniref:prolyl oligopeptidase family serine peptidase n=1 Tax=Porifericola rhodea TaxID=930972 RepID=UPI002665A08B|nr:prolyl oligopeptidase family serine peptidase [Porifericola rhodea]WKN33316.1 prolyl oligopeptidase family serine peptidase [Porifericola rhodea]
MKHTQLICAGLALGTLACVGSKNEETMKLQYPTTQKVAQTDTYFGKEVADPYRWLEDDRSEETAAWVNAQNEVTGSYLENIPFRKSIEERLTELWNYEKYSAPSKKGDKYYFFKNDGLQNQSVLYVQESLESEPEVFLDPNQFSDDGTVSLSTTSFTKDGSLLAYSISESGSDWRKIIVMDVESKEQVGDTLKDVKFSGISWKGNEGFFYSSYDKPEEGSALSGLNMNHKLYYHKLGTPQSEDVLVFGGEQTPRRYVGGNVTEDNRFLSITAANGTSGNELYVKDLEADGDIVQIIDDFEHDNYIAHSKDGQLYILTNLDAPNKRIIKVDAATPEPENWTDLIPEKEEVLQSVSFAGGKIFANYLKDAATRIEQYDLQGKLEKEVALPTIGSAGGFEGTQEDDKLFYYFTSFTYPTSIYAYDIASGESSLFRQAEVDFNPDDYETKQVFYESKDGTQVPMFIVHRKGLKMDGQNPTYLYGYGGFNVSLTPGFSVARLYWLENGGVFAMPNLRGGGEYGEAWHEAGTQMQKQNVFDDFIAAGEYLKNEGYTSKEKLAIAGGSNGGLLVGATMTQRPDLCQVALPAVGVLDMLRYHQFTAGAGWAPDYGIADSSQAMFEYLYAYSPLHNIKQGVEYPATLVTTADHDDRVVPAHSFKFAATLQEKHEGENPVLIRIETKAGHGAGKPTSKQIEEWADKYAFTFYNMNEIPEKLR